MLSEELGHLQLTTLALVPAVDAHNVGFVMRIIDHAGKEIVKQLRALGLDVGFHLWEDMDDETAITIRAKREDAKLRQFAFIDIYKDGRTTIGNSLVRFSTVVPLADPRYFERVSAAVMRTLEETSSLAVTYERWV